MEARKTKTQEEIFREAVDFNLSYLFHDKEDKISVDKLTEFVEAIARTSLNFILANEGISPNDRIPVNMKIRELSDAILSDLEDYSDYLDDFTRKAVE